MSPGNSSPQGTRPSILAELLKPLLLALISGVAGIVTYVLTPLNEVVNSWIWKERAELVLVVQTPSLHEGEVFGLDVIIQPTSPSPISEGTLRIFYPPNISRPAANTRLVFETPRLRTSIRVTQQSLLFLADAAGEGLLRAEFKTKHGLLMAQTLRLEVIAASRQTFPTVGNFSGAWNIDLGRIHGTMTLNERARTLNGEYLLSNGEAGQIEGMRDGKTFRATLYRGAKPSRWWIVGTFDPAIERDIEIQGTAELLIAAAEEVTGWRKKQAEQFHAIARTR